MSLLLRLNALHANCSNLCHIQTLNKSLWVCTFYLHFLFSLFLALYGVLNSSSAVAQFRLVVKTAMKLLLVFVEYSESNAPHLIEAITSVDTKRGAIGRKRCVTFARFFYILFCLVGSDRSMLLQAASRGPTRWKSCRRRTEWTRSCWSMPWRSSTRSLSCIVCLF